MKICRKIAIGKGFNTFGGILVDDNSNSHNSPFKYNGKEFDEETGNYYYSARYYDPKWSIFISVDPLAEKYPNWSPYRYGFNNPIRYTDPTGMLEDDYVFDENGKFLRIDENEKPDKLVIENQKTGKRTSYDFADPKNDTAQIRGEMIDQIIFVNKKTVSNMLKSAGAYDGDNYGRKFIRESGGLGDFDYSYEIIPGLYEKEGASDDPGKFNSPLIFVVEGEKYAHNHMNFGNFLWAASGYSLGYSESQLKTGANLFSLYGRNGSTGIFEPDSPDDQLSISRGANFAKENNFRQYVTPRSLSMPTSVRIYEKF